MLWAANELDTREQADPARQQHREGSQPESPLRTRTPRSRVPPRELPASALVVDMVEEAALRHEQRVRLEWTFCDKLAFVVLGKSLF